MRRQVPHDLFAELGRLQREMQGFPSMNVGSTPRSVEIFAFVPGIDPAGINVRLKSGALVITGKRGTSLPDLQARATVYINERFVGRFRRVVKLPDYVDLNSVEAKYCNGVLHISIQRRKESRPSLIDVK
ncbi:MAG: Hsp20/alpha crystallin family protein [Pseudomonadota bacterium]|nr:Hsp20/alpha crystallin family protein [Pseudomonadota bacterium]